MKQLFILPTARKRFLQGLIMPLLAFIFAIGSIASPAQATGVYDLPALNAGSSTWVVDQADVLSRANEGKFSSELKNLAQQTGNEVRLVAIRRLDYGETIDSFADKLFEKWFPTPQAQAKQTLLVLDTLTNGTALRTGESVKKMIPDELAESIVSESVAIPLREGGQYNRAFLEASDRLVAVLSGEPDPGPPTAQGINIESTFASAEETDDRSATVWVIVLLIVATVIPMATYFWYVGLPGR